MRGAFRLGRVAVRAGQPGQRQGPPQPYGPVGTILSLLLLVSIGVAYPLVALITGGLLVFVAFPLAVTIGREQLARKDGSGHDELDRIMAQWDEERQR